MPMRRRMGRLMTGLAVVVAAAVMITGVMMRKAHQRAGASKPVEITAQTPLPEVARRLQKGDTKALGAVYERVMARQEGVARAMSEDEAQQWVAVLQGLRMAYPRFAIYARASALVVAGRILDKLAIEPSPAHWVDALPPAHDLFTAGMADEREYLRLTAINEVSRFWTWVPSRDLIPVEETSLSDWKESFLAPVVRQLADPQAVVRSAAVLCLAALPIDSAAAPAVAYINDPSPEVRKQVITGFAARPNLLTDETILRRLSDPDPRIPPVVEEVLKARGLSPEQIGLGGMIVHARPEVRESVIPLVENRTDIDPVTWLVYLSRDELDSVRTKAAQALARHDSPEARQRLAEMAIGDASSKVKKLAGRLIAPGEETAALPPLPGSPSLTPKAN